MRVRIAFLFAVLILAVMSGVASGSPSPPSVGLNLEEGPQDHLAPTVSSPVEPGGSLGGFLPPSLDLSHLRGELLPPDLRAADLPARFDWRRDRGIVTRVQDQGECGACYTFGPIASFESRLLIDGAGGFDFSENHAKECIWEEANDWHSSGGRPAGSCDGGNHLQVANLFTQLGTVLEACDPYVASDVQCRTDCAYQKTLLDWRIVNGNASPSPEVIKAYLQQYGPLVTSVYVGSFGAWHNEFVRYDGSYVLYHDGSETTDHCVLIVGWDDDLSHPGGSGAWVVKNSWGTDWGGTCGYGSERGYFYIAYGSASIGSYAAYPDAWQDYDPDGGLWYFDDAGLNDAAGWVGSTTDWGLVRFTAPESTHITRAEFWTTDVTSDVDVYIYGGFDGTRLTNLLYSASNLSYNEAGYRSVPVDPPLPVGAGSTVVAVVKFTNVSYRYPLPLDDRGPSERQRTYHSPTGADGTWSDLGERFGADAGIRLRTSGRQTVPTPTTSPTVKPFTPVAWVRLPIVLKNHSRLIPPTSTPVVTRTPVRTPTEPAGGVRVLGNHSTYVDIIDTLHIVGEVQNDTAHHLRFVRITANVYDGGGHLVDTDFTYTYLDNLPPGERTCFHLMLDASASQAYYEFEAPRFWTDGEPLPNLAVLSDSGRYRSDFGWYEIIGEVRNDQGSRVQYVMPVGTVYDAFGSVIGCDFTYVNATHLEPGQRSSFELTLIGRDYSDVASHRLQVD